MVEVSWVCYQHILLPIEQHQVQMVEKMECYLHHKKHNPGSDKQVEEILIHYPKLYKFYTSFNRINNDEYWYLQLPLYGKFFTTCAY